jgi:hypothetical protein
VPAIEACLQGHNSSTASLTVDKLEARLVVMEAKDLELETKVAELETKDTNQQAEITDLQTKKCCLGKQSR